MLVLSRKIAGQIVIGDDVVITVIGITRRQVRIGIEAPRQVRIMRSELLEQPSTNSLNPPPEPKHE